MAAIEVRETPFGSAAYVQTLQLRHRILRVPLGLDLFAENLAAEKDHRHFSLWQDNSLLACLVIVPLSERKVKLRQMAVNDQYQRRGFGQQLVARVEKQLASEGVNQIELHARVTALPFYLRSGYQSVGEIFIEVGIPHQEMIKMLNISH